MIRVVVKLNEEKYRGAFVSAIYFLNCTGIKFYLWDSKTDYKLDHFRNYILITDAHIENHTVSFRACHQIVEGSLPSEDALGLVKGMSLDTIAQKILHVYGSTRDEEVKTGRCAIHLVTGVSGGCGKKKFANAACNQLLGTNLVCNLIGQNAHSSKPSKHTEHTEHTDHAEHSERHGLSAHHGQSEYLEDVLWEFYSQRQQGIFNSLSEKNNDEKEALKQQISNSGFSSVKELWSLEPVWFIDALKTLGMELQIDNLMLILPSLVLPWSKDITKLADYHWHIHDLSQPGASAYHSFWNDQNIFGLKTKVITTMANLFRGAVYKSDLPFDPDPNGEQYLASLAKVLQSHFYK